MFKATIVPYIHVLARVWDYNKDETVDHATFNYHYDKCKWETEDGFGDDKFNNSKFYKRVRSILSEQTEGFIGDAENDIAKAIRFGIDTADLSEPTIICDFAEYVDGFILDCEVFLYYKIKPVKE